jgi:hypothetical protein
VVLLLLLLLFQTTRLLSSAVNDAPSAFLWVRDVYLEIRSRMKLNRIPSVENTIQWQWHTPVISIVHTSKF